MEAVGKLSALAGAAGVTGLLAAVALAPGAQASSPVHHCGNKTYTIELETGEPGAPPQKFKTPAKNITAQGVSCQAAYKFIAAVYKNHTSTTPEHYKCTLGKFKAPRGLVPQSCTRKGAKITYATQGG
jgi:hypothetical protein